ncbi:MAG: efflux RND transporter periplasmic adaptor subunit [Bacteroidia bacterium]
MKKQIALLLLLPLATACSHKTQLEKDQAKLVDMKKKDGDLKDSIAALQARVDKEQGVKILKTVKVGIEEISPESFRHYVSVQASVYGQDNINVSPEMPGVVKSIFVTEGDKVTKGQILALLDDAVLQENLQELQTSLELTKTLYEKQKSLWDQKIGTEVQYLSAKSNYESLQKRLSALQQQDDMTKIKSPIDGTVDAVNIKVGESVAPGLPTIQVVNTEQLKVKGNVAEAYISDIHTGDSLLVHFPDLNRDISSTVTYVSRAIDPVNRTFTVEVGLPQNPDYHPNMIAMMKIVDYTKKSAIVVPINIVQNDPTGSFVFVAENENNVMVAHKQAVTLGNVYSGRAEILNGIKDGDKVITIGYDDLNNGDAISL